MSQAQLTEDINIGIRIGIIFSALKKVIYVEQVTIPNHERPRYVIIVSPILADTFWDWLRRHTEPELHARFVIACDLLEVQEVAIACHPLPDLYLFALGWTDDLKLQERFGLRNSTVQQFNPQSLQFR